jgi:AcrR family transcriptional regulator
MAATAPRHTRLAPEDRRGQILAVARRLFSERPFSAVSTQEIADAAGVRRGLLNHYFGTKHALYLEVVRDMLAVPAPPLPGELEGRTLEEVWRDAVDRWLTMVERNRGTWLAAMRDPSLAALVDDAREASVTNVLHLIGAPDTPTLRAFVRAYGAGAETATVEWLDRKRLTREQVHDLLVRSLLVLATELRDHAP